MQSAVRECEAAIRRGSVGLRALGLGGSAVGTGLNTHPAYREKAVLQLAKISGVEVHPAV